MSYLEVRSLRVGYGSLPVLQGIDFDVDAGQTTVLLGLNGAGKTTTVASIAGLLKPTAGTITFDGQRIDGRDPAALVQRGIALVPEGRRVFPALTLAQNLRLGSWTTRTRRGELKTAEERVYDYFPILAERRDQLAGTLSGGEQQMLAIGRCLMGQPELIMFDEPSLGLAPIVVQEVLHTIRVLHGRGLTILLVEQNVAVSLKISDRAYVLENGRIVMSGPGEELLHDDGVRQAYLGL